jgi:hypothetical protein
VEEGRIGVAGEPPEQGIPFVPRAADGVEDLVPHPEHAGHQVEVAAEELRLEELAELGGGDRRPGKDRVTGRG